MKITEALKAGLKCLPIAEEFNAVVHLFRRQAVDKAQQSAHLLAHRVALLLCHDQSSMGLTLSMKAAKIGDVEALKDSFFRRREGEVVVVRPLDPVRLVCGQHVHSSGSKRGNQGPVHGVFVEIETNSHTGREPAVCSRSSRSASASSVAKSASIASRLA